MFLPFLPLIFASTSLSLLSGLMERPEPWLKMPIWIVLSAILFFSVIVAQLREKISLISRAELISAGIPSNWVLDSNYQEGDFGGNEIMDEQCKLRDLK